jgi:hypothetical protein
LSSSLVEMPMLLVPRVSLRAQPNGLVFGSLYLSESFASTLVDFAVNGARLLQPVRDAQGFPVLSPAGASSAFSGQVTMNRYALGDPTLGSGSLTLTGRMAGTSTLLLRVP